MSRGLVLEHTITPGEFIARLGDHSARIEAHTCNGRGVYGFAEPHPDELVERALAKLNDYELARRMRAAVPL